MKLNQKITVLVGLAFLSISAFWQMYDNVIPLMLKGTFHLDEALTGAVMAADNILALFLLPFFGALSDRTSTRIGRRMPFILGGTAAAVVLMNLLPVLDNRYAAAPSPGTRAAFVVLLGLLLVAMGTYRSPAVALMPDVTVKPLRSKGNAVINLMGAVGGVLYLIAAAVLYSDERVGGLAHVDYRLLFAIVSGIMVLSVLTLFCTVREPDLAAQAARYEAAHPEEDLTEAAAGSGRAALPPPVRRSLLFLLLSIALWYIAYNAVTTWLTTYVREQMGRALGGASTCLMVATAGAIVSYIPIGEISSRIGRKRTILGGVALLSLCFAAGYVLTALYAEINGVMYAVFALVGLAWAAINVNSLPMVVEMCRGSDVGKFTGYYYTFSMAAQVVTPVLSGWLLGHVGYFTLFPYAAFFSAASFVTMLFVRHGDGRAEHRRGLEAFDVDD